MFFKNYLQISKHAHIKVADLGLATFKNRITGTVCGTPLYMAPEVREGKAYDSKADIYSFGLMMWEMWFGERALPELSSLGVNEVSHRIEEKKYRAERRLTVNSPPAKWIELMASCWDSEPCLRRTATESSDYINAIKYNYLK